MTRTTTRHGCANVVSAARMLNVGGWGGFAARTSNVERWWTRRARLSQQWTASKQTFDSTHNFRCTGMARGIPKAASNTTATAFAGKCRARGATQLAKDESECHTSSKITLPVATAAPAPAPSLQTSTHQHHDCLFSFHQLRAHPHHRRWSQHQHARVSTDPRRPRHVCADAGLLGHQYRSDAPGAIAIPNPSPF
jgi:hypothetical protein